MIIWIIAFWIFVFLIYWLSKKEAHYNRMIKQYKYLMSDDWKIEYMRNIEKKKRRELTFMQLNIWIKTLNMITFVQT